MLPTRCLCCAALLASLLFGQTFNNVTTASGITVPPYTAASFGRGAAWADFDGDGDMDLFAPGGGGGAITLFLNQGGGTFTSQVILPPSATRRDHGCVAADFDNDGDTDVYVAEGNALPNLLFVNDGTGNFTEEAALRGIAHTGYSYCASWGDFDRDGWLDLYVGDLYPPPGAPYNYPAHVLYRNLGNGNFVDVTAAAQASASSAALSVLWHDYDQDGWPDIHCGNDRGNQGAPPNGLLRNLHNGVFSDVAPIVNADAPIGCMGITVGDIHNDGDWDVFCTNTQVGHVLELWNDNLQQFLFVPGNWFFYAQFYGLQTGQIGWGTIFFDYDLDGFLDLFVCHKPGPNRLFRGAGGPPFVDETVLRGIDVITPGTYSCSMVDYDDDGDLDIFLAGGLVAAQLIENTSQGGGWLKVDLEGTVSNRDAFGAVVIARSPNGERWQRMKTSGEGFLSDGDKRVHFGIGSATTVDLEIRWPSGSVTYQTGVAANQVISVVEPSFTLTGSLTPGSVNTLDFWLPDDIGLTWVAGLGVDIFNETPLGDGRILRMNLADPLLALTSTPGNTVFGPQVGSIGATPSQVTVALPPLPWLSGQFFGAIAVTLDATLPGGIKSILGPQGFFVN